MISELSYIGLVSPNYKQWLDYGTKVLGCEIAPAGPDDATRLRVDDMGYRIAIHPGVEDDLGYVGWGLVNERALEEFVAHLRSHGVEVMHAEDEVIAERQAANLYSFDDPFGIRHEISWGRSSYPGTFTPGRRMVGSGFVTGDQGLGHIVLIVPDLEAANAFYADILGFRLSDRIISDVFNLRFYHCNDRHHSLAIAHVPGMVGVNHLMLEATTLDDVGHCIDLCDEHDVDILLSLGRHSNDLMTSIYISTPSSMQIEYGYGGLELDDRTWVARTNHHPSIWGHHRSERYLTSPPGIVRKFEGTVGG